MANNYAPGTFEPSDLPKDFFTEKEMEIVDVLVQVEGVDSLYLYSEEGNY